jgi:hypothetical protein
VTIPPHSAVPGEQPVQQGGKCGGGTYGAIRSPNDRVPQGALDFARLTIQDATRDGPNLWRHLLFLGTMIFMVGVVVCGMLLVIHVTHLPYWLVGVVTAISITSPIGVNIARSWQTRDTVNGRLTIGRPER